MAINTSPSQSIPSFKQKFYQNLVDYDHEYIEPDDDDNSVLECANPEFEEIPTEEVL